MMNKQTTKKKKERTVCHKNATSYFIFHSKLPLLILETNLQNILLSVFFLFLVGYRSSFEGFKLYI